MEETTTRPFPPVALCSCPDYGEGLEAALRSAVEGAGGLGWVRPGMTVALKLNLVSAARPETATTTHPRVVEVLCRMLTDAGAEVVIGDSPGGTYSAAHLERVYQTCGLLPLERKGVRLNRNFTQEEITFPQARVLKHFLYTAYLTQADAVMDVCKLKCHGMMGMSGAVKNLFGTIPGTVKPEYHFRFPRYEDFAAMLLDLADYVHPVLSVVDAVWGMEGNGPTGGDPRQIGVLAASRSPHSLDLACARLIGLAPADVPTLLLAQKEGLLPGSAEELKGGEDIGRLALADFRNIAVRRDMEFAGDGKSPLKRLRSRLIGGMLRSRPALKPAACVGCGVCASLCPVKAIRIDGRKKAVIDRKKCIRCFCCQEFCPKSAMQVHRPLVARIASKM